MDRASHIGNIHVDFYNNMTLPTQIADIWSIVAEKPKKLLQSIRMLHHGVTLAEFEMLSIEMRSATTGLESWYMTSKLTSTRNTSTSHASEVQQLRIFFGLLPNFNWWEGQLDSSGSEQESVVKSCKKCNKFRVP